MMPLTIEYLNELINNSVEENSQLEYKSARAIDDKESISIDVSSFANAAGGTIIYGIKEYDEKEKRHLPEKLDPVSRLKYSREWLDQVIHSNIHPKIDGVVITPIPGSNPAEVFYMVEIPQSTTAHQAADKRYYRRYITQKLPMEDYEIRDVMNRQKHPEVGLTFELESSTVSSAIRLSIYLENKGNVLANYCNFFLEVLSAMISEAQHPLYKKKPIDGVDYFLIYGENTRRDLIKPILPGRRFFVREIEIDHNFLAYGPKDISLTWEVYADNAQKRISETKFNEIKRTAK